MKDHRRQDFDQLATTGKCHGRATIAIGGGIGVRLLRWGVANA
ncbi:MAG TPA: hypothetical protein VKD72_14120 [Gemmataceae bacterium]|nr:hypothetical protein [Gemmataceae bacterium]